MSGHSTRESFAVTLEGRRRRSRSEKEAIVAELNASGETVSAVARKHNLAPSLLFRWRREFGVAEPTPAKEDSARSFVPVALPAPVSMPEGAKPASRTASDAAMEIVLTCGRRVIVGPDVDASALKRVIEALEVRPVSRLVRPSAQRDGGSLGEG